MVFYNGIVMGKKRNKKNAETPETPHPNASTQEGGGGGARWIAVALLVLGTGVFLYALNTDPPASNAHPASHSQAATSATTQKSEGQARRYRYFENAEDAHPLPVTLPPSEFDNAGIANSYAIAKEIPEVLAQQPCLCGCDNSSDDHRSLLDCYIDGHASTCMVCMKEAVFAKQKTEAGKSGAWIRDAILRHEFSRVNIGAD
jgi:hypothetical protein